jgi:hypothetical protein
MFEFDFGFDFGGDDDDDFLIGGATDHCRSVV